MLAVAVVGDLEGLVTIGVDGVDGDSIVPPRTAPAPFELAELGRLKRSRSALSIEGVGEFR
jgi:hypothetical protein